MPKSSKERGAEKPDATPQDSSVQKRASRATSAAPEVDRKAVSRKNRAGQVKMAAPEQVEAVKAGPVKSVLAKPVPAKSRASESAGESVTAAQKKAVPGKTVGRPSKVAPEQEALVATVVELETAPVQTKSRRAGGKTKPTVPVQTADGQKAGAVPARAGRRAGVPAAPAEEMPVAAEPAVSQSVASEPSAGPVAGAVPELALKKRGRKTQALPSPEVVAAPLAARSGGKKATSVKASRPAEVATLEAEAVTLVPVTPVSRRSRKGSAQVTQEAVVPDARDTVPEAVQTAPETVRPGQRRGRKPRAEVGNSVVETALVEEPEVAASDGNVVAVKVVKVKPAPRRTKKQRQQDELAAASAAEVETENATGDNSDAEIEETPDAHPAQSLVVEQLRKLGRPVHIRDFERSFTRQGREKLGQYSSDLSGLMDELVHAGLVIQTRKRTYGLPEAMNLVRGRFQASKSGFGFVVPDSGGDDYYIPEGSTMEAWTGDTVLIRPEGRGGRRGDSPAGVVVRVVERSSVQLVGSLEHSHGYAFLKPDDARNKNRIMLVPEGLEGLPDGARMVTKLFWPEETGEDEVYGQVLKVLGNEDDPETETLAVIIKYGLRGDFPDEVLEEAEAIPARIPEAALSGRLDLRSYNIFTVDGRDAKDFDDAIHIQPTPEGNFVVGVHIADVSHYVKAGQPLDDEAYARATSVYLPGQVLPMLPEHLSNGVCSLVPDEDRLTLSALIEINLGGDVLGVQLTPSVIRSKARLTYDEVQAYSEAVATLPEQARALEGDLHLLLKITSRLRQRRLREGALDFKMREVKVDVGKDGHLELVPVREETARGMIEDLMLLANKVVARALLERNVPGLYRIHEEPTLARFQDVSSAIGRLGLAFPGNEPTPQAYQAVLKQVRGTGQETAVNTLLLRSMQQAKYAGENLGHFGLAFDEYLHFTSPIRRYPDLLVHRMLKASLSGELSDRLKADVNGRLSEMGRHTSERERTASEAERDLTKYYQAKWAQENLDGVFPGYVSGVIASGLFVALENGVEGRIHISNLDDDYYLYIEEAGILKGKTSGRVFRVGENITIRITQVNPLARQIEFSQESNMDGNEVRPRARRGGDRESSKREKLSTMVPSVPVARTSQEEQQQAAPNASRPPRIGSVRPDAGKLDAGNPDTGKTETGRSEARQARAGTERPAQRSASPSGGLGGGKRRIITLDRPRNEHLRPVNVTVQRMYFGDWTLDNMPPEDGQGGGNYQRSGGGSGGFRGGRPQQGSARSNERQTGERQTSERTGGSAGRAQSGQPRDGQSRAPRQQAAPAQTSVAVTASSEGADSADASKRRRRRRGRRGGNGATD